MSGERKRVLVLMGGPDAEREVSITSGRAVAQALRECGRFDVIEEVIDRPSLAELDAMPGDVIFPVLHGQWGEGGPLQELLEAMGRPYVGCGPEAASTAMDKMKTKVILSRAGVDSPLAIEIGPDDPCRIEPPLVLKPVDDGSSVDIRICRSVEEIEAGRAALHPRRARLMAERYVPGRELTVGVVNGVVLPIIEIIPAVAFYDYDAKYVSEETKYVLDPDLKPAVSRQCREWTLLAWEHLGCRDVARADFRLDPDDRLWFLEINTMPGFTSHSLVPKAAAHVGIAMPPLCASLVEAALARAEQDVETEAA